MSGMSMPEDGNLSLAYRPGEDQEAASPTSRSPPQLSAPSTLEEHSLHVYHVKDDEGAHVSSNSLITSGSDT